MSGHSKWAKIKRQKAVSDAKKGQIFSKLVREITIAAKSGGDPGMNFKLRLALERARDAGMLKDAMERAIQRGTGESKEGQLEDMVYEGYGPAGTAFLIQAATDNRNRTTAELRHLFSQYGGNLAGHGSVAFLFESRGQILAAKGENKNLEEVSLLAIDLGAEDVKVSEEGLEIYTVPVDLEKIKTALREKGAKIASYEVASVPKNLIEPTDAKTSEQILKLLEALEANEDVVTVNTNANL